MDPPSKRPAPTSLPAPWAPYSQRPLPARIQGLLSRAALALQPALDEEQQDERRVERRVVGLTLETELRGLASRVGAGLALHQTEVSVCAQLLEVAGEPGRAGRLLLDASLMAEAARLAEAAGDLETLQKALEGTHAPVEQAHAAALAFQHYETELASRRLSHAVVALERAHQARPENASYPQLLEGWRNRRPTAGRLLLTSEHSGALCTITVSPAWLGRGAEAAIKLAAPGVSRLHWQVVLAHAEARVLDGRAGVRWHAALGGPAVASELMAGNRRVQVALAGEAVRLRAEDSELDAWVVALGRPAHWSAQVTLTVTDWPAAGFPHVVVAGAPWTVNAEPAPAAGSDLALGDVMAVGGLGAWRVTG